MAEVNGDARVKAVDRSLPEPAESYLVVRTLAISFRFAAFAPYAGFITIGRAMATVVLLLGAMGVIRVISRPDHR
jgi:hypothetical protein